MKVDVPASPPEGVDFPGYIGWFHSSILVPYPLYIITTVDEHGMLTAHEVITTRMPDGPVRTTTAACTLPSAAVRR